MREFETVGGEKLPETWQATGSVAAGILAKVAAARHAARPLTPTPATKSKPLLAMDGLQYSLDLQAA